jgi:hypothetical protein
MYPIGRLLGDLGLAPAVTAGSHRVSTYWPRGFQSSLLTCSPDSSTLRCSLGLICAPPRPNMWIAPRHCGRVKQLRSREVCLLRAKWNVGLHEQVKRTTTNSLSTLDEVKVQLGLIANTKCRDASDSPGHTNQDLRITRTTLPSYPLPLRKGRRCPPDFAVRRGAKSTGLPLPSDT